MFGLAATDGDLIAVCGRTSLFVGDGRHFEEYPAPDDVKELRRVHGLRADEFYACADAGICRWDGEQLALIESPEDDILDVMVLSENELLAVGERAHRWRDNEGWSELESPTEDHARGMCRLGGEIYVPSLDGVLRVEGDELTMISPSPSNLLVPIGKGIVAARVGGGAWYFDGKTWARVTLPTLAPNENP